MTRSGSSMRSTMRTLVDPTDWTCFADSIPWPAIMLDDAGLVLYLNASMREQGVVIDGAAPRGVEKLFPHYVAALRGKVPWLEPQQARVVRQAGEHTIHERVWVRRLPWGACLIVMDETRLHELEAEHAQTARLASLGFMLASVSHEINNPLTAIHSIVQILQSKRGVTPAILEKGLLNVATSVRRMLAITRKLNAFARADEDAARAFPIDTAIDEAVALFGYDSFGETIELNHRRDPEAVVWGYAGELAQVFFNLFLNAAQAMKGRGSIQVSTERVSASAIEVLIRDRGPGLPADLLPKIFEPFFSTKQNGEGTGLGLAISLEIMHEHAGSIVASNNADGGACFRIRLPLHQAV